MKWNIQREEFGNNNHLSEIIILKTVVENIAKAWPFRSWEHQRLNITSEFWANRASKKLIVLSYNSLSWLSGDCRHTKKCIKLMKIWKIVVINYIPFQLTFSRIKAKWTKLLKSSQKSFLKKFQCRRNHDNMTEWPSSFELKLSRSESNFLNYLLLETLN